MNLGNSSIIFPAKDGQIRHSKSCDLPLEKIMHPVEHFYKVYVANLDLVIVQKYLVPTVHNTNFESKLLLELRIFSSEHTKRDRNLYM